LRLLALHFQNDAFQAAPDLPAFARGEFAIGVFGAFEAELAAIERFPRTEAHIIGRAVALGIGGKDDDALVRDIAAAGGAAPPLDHHAPLKPLDVAYILHTVERKVIDGAMHLNGGSRIAAFGTRRGERRHANGQHGRHGS